MLDPVLLAQFDAAGGAPDDELFVATTMQRVRQHQRRRAIAQGAFVVLLAGLAVLGMQLGGGVIAPAMLEMWATALGNALARPEIWGLTVAALLGLRALLHTLSVG